MRLDRLVSISFSIALFGKKPKPWHHGSPLVSWATFQRFLLAHSTLRVSLCVFRCF